MVRVRLSRAGAKKRPYYHIVVIDKKDRRDGRCLERIGSYQPSLETEDRIKLDHERLEHWVSKGAQISERVKHLKKYSLDSDNISKYFCKFLANEVRPPSVPSIPPSMTYNKIPPVHLPFIFSA